MVTKKFYGERLREARMYRGLTLTELAQRVDISKQSLSLYENNNNTPDYMKVRALAKELNFPYDYFFQNDGKQIDAKATYFRSFASANKKSRIQQSMKLGYVAQIYRVFSEYISFPSLNLPDIKFTETDDIFGSDTAIAEMENIATQVRTHWELGTGPIRDLQYVLEKNGLVITGFRSDEDRIDAFSQQIDIGTDERFFIALVIGEKPEVRIQFDMAHELGHILLHPWSEDLETISKDEFKARERQANVFAGALLLPRDTFGKELSVYPTDLRYYEFLKKKWNVSIQAMIFRGHQIHAITDNQYQYLMRQVSKNGWRTREPGDTPYYLNKNLFQSSIDLLMNSSGVSSEQILGIFKENGISFYPEDIEDLLNLETGTLKTEEQVAPIIELRRNN